MTSRTPGGDPGTDVAAALEQPLGGEQTGQLGDEERVAVGAVVDRRHDRGVRLDVGLLGHETGHLGFAEPVQAQPGRVGQADQLAKGGGQRVLRRDVLRPVGADEQDRGRPDSGGQESGQLQRGDVEPVQVVEDQHHRPLDRQAEQQLGHRLVETEAGSRGIQRGEGWNLPHQLTDLRGDLGDLAGHRTDRGPRRLGVDLSQQRSDDLYPRPERRHAVPLVPPPPRHQRPAERCASGQLLDQPGLADARLTGDQYQLAVASPGPVEGLQQGRQRPFAPDEPTSGMGYRCRRGHGGGTGEGSGRLRLLGREMELQRRRLAEHVRFEPAQGRAGLGAQLLAQYTADLSGRAQRITLAPRPVQGHHQQPPQPFV
jgi:hypothetical protein